MAKHEVSVIKESKEFVYVNIDGAIRQLKYMGMRLENSIYGPEINAYAILVDGSGKRYDLRPYSYGQPIFGTLEEAKREKTENGITEVVDVDRYIYRHNGCISLTGTQFVAWMFIPSDNKARDCSVGHWYKNDKLKSIDVFKDGHVEYVTESGKKVFPDKSKYFIYKDDCLNVYTPAFVPFEEKDESKADDVVEVRLRISKGKFEELKKLDVEIL